ncbi:DedA family protein [Neisseriaceae bacterium JH1-16]|nr:DedA family protein [Neisseriaceae bacterium JH1-16]
MDFVIGLIHFILHLDVHLQALCLQYGPWIYGVLFLVVFCETGLVVAPFLPGDSLLFAGGALAAGGALNPHLLVLTLVAAAFLGDNVNYWVGRRIGLKLFSNPQSRVFRRSHLERTQAFFADHGGKTIVIGRFLPILRTYVPFAAGSVGTPYRYFLGLSLVGSCCWVPLFIYGGLLFGNLPLIAHNFSLLTLGIIGVSLLPLLVGAVRARRAIS